MEYQIKYKYHFRPAYGSSDLLIEIFSCVENNNFGKDFFDAIRSINPRITDLTDLWINNEVLLTIESDFGAFLFSQDIWDNVFLMSSSNQSCLNKINSILSNDSRFEKIDITTKQVK